VVAGYALTRLREEPLPPALTVVLASSSS
jgi:hypothetical protein